MKHITSLALLIIGSLPLLAPVFARAASAMDVALGASIAGLASPIAVQALTRSSLSVQVDVYRDTFSLMEYGTNRTSYWLTNSIEKRRSAPFKLNGPLALRRLSQEAGDPAAHPSAHSLTEVAKRLSAMGEGLSRRSKQLRETENLLGKLKSSDSKNIIEAVAEVKQLAGSSESLASTMTTYSSAVEEALKDGRFTAEEMEKSVNYLLAVRLCTKSTSTNNLVKLPALFLQQVKGAFDNAKEGAGAASNNVTTAATITEAELNLPKASTFSAKGSEKMIQILESAVILRAALEKSKGLFTTAQNKRKRLSLTDLDTKLSTICASFGVVPTWEQLRQTNLEGRSIAVDGNILVTQALDSLWAESAGITYDGVTSGANYGPIANEVIQAVLSNSRLIDQILEGNRWTAFNHAKSSGGAGDHNAVVYMDNMVTPMLKSASFDPSQFIAANAEIYKRAASSLTKVYGIPMTKDGEDKDGAASLNLLNLRARKQNADTLATQRRKELLDAMQNLIALHKELLGNLKTKDNTLTWTDESTARTNLVPGYLKKLSEMADRIEQK